MPSKEDRDECQFTLQSFATGAIMSQRIDLTGIVDFSIWVWASVELQWHMSGGVSMDLNVKNSSGIIVDKTIIGKLSIFIIDDMFYYF
jgi:hypothetical protein